MKRKKDIKIPPLRVTSGLGGIDNQTASVTISGSKVIEEINSPSVSTIKNKVESISKEVKQSKKKVSTSSRRKKQSKITLKHDINLVHKAMNMYGLDFSSYVNLCIGFNLMKNKIADK